MSSRSWARGAGQLLAVEHQRDGHGLHGADPEREQALAVVLPQDDDGFSCLRVEAQALHVHLYHGCPVASATRLCFLASTMRALTRRPVWSPAGRAHAPGLRRCRGPASLQAVVVGGLAAAGVLQQHFAFLAHASVEPALGKLLLQGLQAQQTILLHVGGRSCPETAGPGAGTVRIAEGEAGHEVAGAHQLQRGGEIFLGLAGEAHDEVRGQGDVRAGVTQAGTSSR